MLSKNILLFMVGTPAPAVVQSFGIKNACPLCFKKI
jgi:hypothetical protein